MGKTSLIVKALDSNGKLLQKTVTDVNPDATNETLATFGQMVNALTTHTYSGTDRVDKINCDTETTPVDTRLDNTITLGELTTVDPTFTMAQLNTVIQQQINSTSSGTPYLTYVAPGVQVVAKIVSTGSGYKPWIYINNANNQAQAGKACTITVDGDDTYKPATLDIILTD